MNWLMIILGLILVSCSHQPPKNEAPAVPPAKPPLDYVSACAKGEDQVVADYLKGGVPVDQVKGEGVTCLMVAARKGHTKIVELLLNAGANPDTADFQGATALFYAILGGQSESTRLLIQKGASVNIKDHFQLTPLMMAARFSDLSTIKVLIEAGADISERDDSDWTAIFFTIPRGNQEIFEYLTRQIPSVDLQDSDGDSLLLIAVDYGNTQFALNLLNMRANPLLANRSGVTPLELAIRKNDLEMVALLSQFVDVGLPMPDGKTPLMLAIDLRRRQIACLIYSKKFMDRTKDKQGKTAADHLEDAGLDHSWLTLIEH